MEATKPTGQEHLTPVNIMMTSATERAGFRKCRRLWFLTTVHRLNSGEGNPNYFLGTLFHYALEKFYVAKQEGKAHDECATLGLDAYQELYDAELVKLADYFGPYFWDRAKDDWRTIGELGFEMSQEYFERERHDPIFDEIVMVEVRVAVPIMDGTKMLGELTVKTDLIGRRNGVLGVADHKTAKREPNSAHLDMDDQLTAEIYSTWKFLGEFPETATYNVAMKRIALPPKLIKKGKALSMDKSQNTNAALYRQAVRENNFNIMDYIDHIQWLEQQEAEDSRYFSREDTFRTPEQMAAFERNLLQEFKDMREVAAHPEKAYPNPTEMNCSHCPVREICTTIQDDGDVSAIILANYVVGEPRY